MDEHSIDQTRSIGLETVGKRIAQLRTKAGLTQQALANRIAISRVAISHIEMDLTLPSERTVTLLAGIFKLSPHELIEGTLYPRAKAERLPPETLCYTKLELDLALLENDLEWLERLADRSYSPDVREEVVLKWSVRMENYLNECTDEGERGRINVLLKTLRTQVGYSTPRQSVSR